MNPTRSENLRHHLDQAELARAAGLHEVAQTHLQEAVPLDPSSRETRELQAQLAMEQGQPQQALAALDALDLYLGEQAAKAHHQMQRAAAYLRCGQVELALACLQRLVREYPDDVRPHQLLATVALNYQHPELAEIHLQHVLRLQPGHAIARRLLAQLWEKKDPQRAIELLGEDLPAQDPAIQLRLARLYRVSGRYREAEDTFRQLLQPTVQDAQLFLEAGTLADDMGEHELALHRLQQAAHGRGDAAIAACAALAKVQMHRGDFITAGRTWFRFGQLSRDLLTAHTGLFICAQQAQRLHLAQRLQKQLQLQHSPRERRLALASLWPHALRGRLVRQVMQQEVPVLGTGNPWEYLLQRTRQILQRQSQQTPERADVQYHLALTCEAQGDVETAIQAAERALTLNHQYAAAGRLAVRLGRKQRRAA